MQVVLLSPSCNSKNHQNENICIEYIILKTLRWHGRPSAEVNENINLGYSQDQGYS